MDSKQVSEKLAIIDCGTNTFNLLVLEKVEGKWKSIFQNKLPVKLGAGGFDEGILLEARMARGVDALLTYKNTLKNLEVSKVRVFATSAVREAKNGTFFVKKVKEILGFDIEVISGDREAELIFKGVQLTTKNTLSDFLIIDIGGGSTEFILVKNNEPVWKKSYLLGISRLYDAIQPQDRLVKEDVEKLRKILQRELIDLKVALSNHPVNALVGSSGSFDTFSDLYYFQTKKNHERLDLTEVPSGEFSTMHQFLVGSSLAERKKHPAIPAIRAEFMPLASHLVKYVYELGNIKQIYCSTHALKEGVLSELEAQ